MEDSLISKSERRKGVKVVSDNVIDEKDSEEESFADLFESYGAGRNEDIQIGDKIRGEIISIGRNTVFIDTGSKIDGVVDKEELLDDNLLLKVNRCVKCKNTKLLWLLPLAWQEGLEYDRRS